MKYAVIAAAFVVLSAPAGSAFAQAKEGEPAVEKKEDGKRADKSLTGSAEKFAECRDQVQRMAPQGSSARRSYIENGLARCKEEAKGASK